MPRIPKSKGKTKSTTSASTGRIPASTKNTTGQTDFNPFLKAANIGRGSIGERATLVLTGNVRVTDSDFGEQIVAEVKHGRSMFDWGVKMNTPNHRYLEENFGVETKRWKGKKVPVIVKENMGRLYIAIERPRQRK